MPLSGNAAVINTRYCNTPAGMFHVKHFQPEKHSRKSTPGKTIQETDPGNGSGKAIQKTESRKQNPGTGSKYRVQVQGPGTGSRYRIQAE